MPLSSHGFAVSCFKFPRRRAGCVAPPLWSFTKTPRPLLPSPVMSGKSNLLVNEFPITRNALLAHSRFDNALSIPAGPIYSPLKALSIQKFRLQKGCKGFADGHFFNFYLSNSPFPRLPLNPSASHPSLLSFRQHGQFRSRAVQSFPYLQFFSLTFKQHIPYVFLQLPL